MPDFDPIGKMAAINAIMAGFHAAIQMLFAKRVYWRAATEFRQEVFRPHRRADQCRAASW